MRRNTKVIEKNERARKEILIAPSKLPRFPLALRFQRRGVFAHDPHRESASGPKFAARMASTACTEPLERSD